MADGNQLSAVSATSVIFGAVSIPRSGPAVYRSVSDGATDTVHSLRMSLQRMLGRTD
jgi:hypothetical protein